MNFTKLRIVSSRKWLLAVLGAATAVLIVGYFGYPPQPYYKRKSLDSWLQFVNDTCTDNSSSNWREKMSPRLAQFYEAIDAMGTNALPFLLSYATNRDSRMKIQACDFFNRYRLPRLGLHLAEERQGPALLALAVLGLRARSIIPECVELFNRRPDTALLPLLLLGKEAETAFWSLCESTNQEARLAAVLGLAKVQQGSGYTECWQRGTFRTNLIYVMSCDAGPEEAETLARNLTHSNIFVRRASAEALGHYRTMTSGRLPAVEKSLEKCIDDPSPLVREAARDSMRRIKSYR
jgi:hypothetical protein